METRKKVYIITHVDYRDCTNEYAETENWKEALWFYDRAKAYMGNNDKKTVLSASIEIYEDEELIDIVDGWTIYTYKKPKRGK